MTQSPLLACLHSGHEWLVRGATLLASPFLLVIRLYWGWQFFQTGLGKLRHFDDTAEYFGTLTLFASNIHLPLPALNAALAGTTECVGGLLLLLGLGSRLVALPLVFTMIVAYCTAEFDTLKVIFSDPDQFLKADPFRFLLASLILLIFGPGVFSLDWLLAKRWPTLFPLAARAGAERKTILSPASSV